MDKQCKDCGGKLTQLYDDTPDIIGCEPCYTAMEREYAKRSTLSHLFAVFWYLFNFSLSGAIGALGFAIERFFGIGDYNPKTGRFYKKGYLTKK